MAIASTIYQKMQRNSKQYPMNILGRIIQKILDGFRVRKPIELDIFKASEPILRNC